MGWGWGQLGSGEAAASELDPSSSAPPRLSILEAASMDFLCIPEEWRRA